MTEEDGSPHFAPGYYVSRAYRYLWVGLLFLGTVWGLLSGVSIATGMFLSASAVLMGLFGTVVLAVTLFTAGSRDRIRIKR